MPESVKIKADRARWFAEVRVGGWPFCTMLCGSGQIVAKRLSGPGKSVPCGGTNLNGQFQQAIRQ